MASQEVLIALETLHREIEKLEPAIKHVETAQQVTEIIKSIPQKHLDLLKDVKSADTKHKEDLKNLFANNITELSEECNKIQQSTAVIQKAIQSQQKEIDKLLKSISESYSKINDTDIPGKLLDISEFVTANNGFLDELHKSLPEEFLKLAKDMEKIHSATIRSLQKILDFQRDNQIVLQKGLEQTKTALQTAVDAAAKKQQTFTYITWALVVVAIIITFVLKK